METVHPVQMGLLTINNRQFRLYEGINTIGRNREAVVNIKHLIISQNHAIIMILNGQYFISDLKSSNGSYVNDVKLTPLKVYPLTNNSKITLGNLPGAFTTTVNAPAEDLLVDNLAPTQSFFEGSTQLMEHSVAQSAACHDEPTQEICWSDIQAVKPLKTLTLYDLPPPGPHLSQIHDEHLPALESIVNCPEVDLEPEATAEAVQVGEEASEISEQLPESIEPALDNTEVNSALLNATNPHSPLGASSGEETVVESGLTAEVVQAEEQTPEILEQLPENNELARDNSAEINSVSRPPLSPDANSDDEATDCEENCDNSNAAKDVSKGGQVSIITDAFCDKSNESLEFLNCEKSPTKPTTDMAESSSSLDESLAFKRTRKSFMVISTQDFDVQNSASNEQGCSQGSSFDESLAFKRTRKSFMVISTQDFDVQNSASNEQGCNSETETYQQFEDTIPATQEQFVEDLDESDFIAATQAATASTGSESKSQNTESEVFKLGLTQLMDQNNDSMPETSLNMFGSPAGAASQEIQAIFDVAAEAEQPKSFTEEVFLAPTQKIVPSSKMVFTLANNEDIYEAPTQKANVMDTAVKRLSALREEDTFDLFEAPTQKINFFAERSAMDDSFLQPTQKLPGSFTSEVLDEDVDYDSPTQRNSSPTPLERDSATAEDIFLAPTQKIRCSAFTAAAEEDDADLFLAPTQKILCNPRKSRKRTVDAEAADFESKRPKKMFSFKKKACDLDASLSVLSDDESKSNKAASSNQTNGDKSVDVEADNEVDAEASISGLETVEKRHSCEATGAKREEASKIVTADRPEGAFKRVSSTGDHAGISTCNLQPVEKTKSSRLRRMASHCGSEAATEANTEKNNQTENSFICGKVEDGAKGTVKSVQGIDDDVGAFKSNLETVDKSGTRGERQHDAKATKSQELADLQGVEDKPELKRVIDNGDDAEASKSKLEVVEKASAVLLKKPASSCGREAVIGDDKNEETSKSQYVTIKVEMIRNRRKLLNTPNTSEEAVKGRDVSKAGSTSINQSMALLESKMAKTKKSITTEKIKISFPKDRKSMELSIVEKDKLEEQSEAPKPTRGRRATTLKNAKLQTSRRHKPSEPVEELSSAPPVSEGSSSSSQDSSVLSGDKKAVSKRGRRKTLIGDVDLEGCKELSSKSKLRGNRKDPPQAKEALKVARLAAPSQRSVEDLAAADMSPSKKQRVSVPSPDTPQRGTLRKQRHKVVFTMMDSPQLESLVKQLGGSIVDSVETCTVLVTQQVKRSQKLLTAIGLGRPICTPQWITDSKKSKQFLDPWDYILTDPEAETKWSFSLKESLQRGRTDNLLKPYNFYIQVTNAVDALKGAIQACGGKCLSRIPSGPLEHAYVISSPDNRAKHSKIVQKHPHFQVIEAEAVFDAVLRQEIRFSRHYLS